MSITATFEAGSNGSNIATTDTGAATAWDAVGKSGTGATNQYDNTHVAHGSLAAKLFSGTASRSAYLGWSTAFGSQTDHYGRLYIYNNGGWDTTAFLLVLDGGAAQALRLLLRPDYLTQVRDAADSIVGLSANALTISSWNRIEWHMVASDTVGSIELKLFLGANYDGATPDETLTITGLNTSSSHAQIRFGVMSNDQVTTWFDDIVAAAGAYPGPVSSGGIPFFMQTDLLNGGMQTLSGGMQ